MHEKIRDSILSTTGRSVATRWRLVLLIGFLLTAASVWLTASRLEFRSDRSSLVSMEKDWNARYLAYKQNYPRWDDLTVCLAGPADAVEIDEFARSLATALAAEPYVMNADAGFDPQDANPRLFRIDEAESFAARLKELGQARALAEATSPLQVLAMATAGLQVRDDGPERIGELQLILGPFIAALRGEPVEFGFLDPSRSAPGWEPFRSSSGSIRYILVQTARPDETAVDAQNANLTTLRSRIGELVDAARLPELEWGVTGIEAIEADETAQSIRDSTLASIVATVLITILMISVYRGIVLPLLAAGSLLIGVAWSFGWLVVSVGHLQLLSVVFTVILLGLGIDFALHIVARLELIQDEHDDLPSAMARVMRGIGPGLVTGALTVAAAFGAVAVTDFTGMAEMGLIAAGGVLLCLLAMCTVFPALIAATGRWKTIIRHREGGETAHFAAGRLDLLDGNPVRTLIVAAVIVIGMIGFGTTVRYDPNVLNLHPPGVESVIWEHRIVAEDARTVWAARIPVAPQDAPRLADALRELDEVGGVGGVGMLFPADRAARHKQVQATTNAPVLIPNTDAGFTALRGQVAGLNLGLRNAVRAVTGPERARLDAIIQEMTTALRASAALAPEVQAQRWQALVTAFATTRPALAGVLRDALDDEQLSAADLPPALAARWIGQDGTWLLEAYPRHDPDGGSVLDPDRLGPFVESIRTVAPDVLGPPVQIYESSRLIIREYIKAAIYALIVILLLLLADLRSLADAVCAMAPVTVGFVGAFGVMGILDEPLNFANIIVLPLIFGIGVAAGVHMVHRWRVEPGGRPAGLSGGTGRGITLTLLTTIIGFSSMLLAEHRGIRSLGLVMVAGLAVTLAACYSVLPALLRLRKQKRT